ncbi:serine hydrolase domain-containing protein, partial [Mycobacterium sp. UM_Kg1]|uniref:serine hydrolase domain-containing protein n=1 Tax=Mycobacterium sp. UM_Kg1 TaxID=1545691 RepID=UPI00061B0D65
MSAEAAGRIPAGISLDNWLSVPYSRWSFQHVEDFVATALISRGTGHVAAFPGADTELSAIAVTATDGTRTTVGAIMAATATDGWAVGHRGTLVTEAYLGTLGTHTRHLLFSVSKSLVAAVVGALHEAIDLDAAITSYVPALAASGYAGATVRHLLDMRSGIAFSDNYLHPTAEIHLLDESVGWAPRSRAGGPDTLRDFLLTLRQKSPHGGPFEYRSCETDVLGWVCEAVAGRRMPELMSELLWSRLGAQQDATIGVDAAGTGLFDGGISACLTAVSYTH